MLLLPVHEDLVEFVNAGVAGFIAGVMADDTVREKTGRDWAAWTGTLDELGAASLAHGEIARIVHERFEISGWWAQTVTVGYERIRGLREQGQRRSGAWEISRSRTFAAPVDRLFDAWADEHARGDWLTDAQPTVKLSDRESGETLKTYWSERLDALAAWLAASAPPAGSGSPTSSPVPEDA